MPATRRRRANPPEQPDSNNNNANHAAATTPEGENPLTGQQPSTGPSAAIPEAKEQTPPAAANGQIAAEEQSQPSPSPATPTSSSAQPSVSHTAPTPFTSSATNGDRPERQDYTPTIEGGRRTSRGELFRRPPQIPAQVQQLSPSHPAPTQPQPPSHEISLPLGNLLHLAYNPGYTGADEARSALLQKLSQESKNGGRARCWNCGSLAIIYDRWNTRSKTFGEVGVAICEICGVWSVM